MFKNKIISKTEQQKHGVLMFDEISIRKSLKQILKLFDTEELLILVMMISVAQKMKLWQIMVWYLGFLLFVKTIFNQ